jgi:plastocyanin
VLALIAGLSTGHKIGLAIVGVAFIGFALAASFLAPRRWPDFPGRHGLSVFVIACFVFFFGMLAAVYFFGKESEETAKAAESPAAKPTSHTIKVTESEWKVVLPASSLTPGTYTFDVHNAGKIPHDLVVTASEKTALIKPGADAKLTVSLSSGTYTLYCSVAGHRQLGMQAKLSVG